MAGLYAHAKRWNRQRRPAQVPAHPPGPPGARHTPQDRRHEALKEIFAILLTRAAQVGSQQQRQRGWKLYSLHAPEVECIAKGKAHKPYELGCKDSITTTNAKSPGDSFVLLAKGFHGRPYDGHTLGAVITETQTLTGIEIKRAYFDKGYVGHNAPNPRRVYRSGQKRGVHGQIKRDLRRRASIDPVIGHLKSEGRLGRNYLKGLRSNRPKACGDHANAVLTATGHNFRLVPRWPQQLLREILNALVAAIWPASVLRTAS